MPTPRRTAYISSRAQAAFACLLALGSLAGASSPTSTSPPTNGTTTASPPSNTTVVTPFSPAAYDRPYAGTPASYFTSSASPEVVALLQHAASNGSYPVDKYSVEHGSKGALENEAFYSQMMTSLPYFSCVHDIRRLEERFQRMSTGSHRHIHNELTINLL